MQLVFVATGEDVMTRPVLTQVTNTGNGVSWSGYYTQADTLTDTENVRKKADLNAEVTTIVHFSYNRYRGTRKL